ncbi:HAMP domain-containing protein [Streptomyces tubercidicus]|uniref:HAMP domain-containing protein n=1 Tax=Streptomyces tubercidicus TaxID=47759 RepID=UPI002E12E53A|nr:HAMP domain-containing protein [Streptomyces tubercidicus]WSX22832.1 HAMP domain-containing protein [Streptomyces tubercidicus]
MSLLGGVRPPIAVLSALLLALAAVTALSLGRVGHDRIPEAVLTSQQQFAEDGAIAMRASVDESVTDLQGAAGLFRSGAPVPADAVLDKVGSVYQKWRGTAVIEVGSGKLLAARGENLPLATIDRGKLSEKGGLGPRMVRLANGETRLLSFALLSWDGRPQQLLVASRSLRVPAISLGRFRTIAVLDSTGAILSRGGSRESEQDLDDPQRKAAKRADGQLRAFARTAAEKARQHPLKAREPGSGGFPGVSGSLTGGASNGERAAAGYATLAPARPGESTVAGGLGLTVVTMVDVAEDPSRGTDPLFGIAAAGALLVIGAAVVALLLGLVQRPLLRLFLESRRLAGGELQRPVSVPAYGEAARVGHALERLRCQLLGAPQGTSGPATPRRLRRIGARGLTAVCAVLLLAWSAPLALSLHHADSKAVIPQQIVNDQRERTDTLADRVRRALDEGHTDLVSVASLIGDRTSPDQMATVLERTLQEHPRYASLYLLGADGKVLARAGGTPHHPAGKGPGTRGVTVLNEGGKEPVVTGYAEVPGRKGAAVAGEFRVDFFNSLLKRPGLGEVRVVDDKRRTLGGNTGYRAFEKLPSERIDTLVQGTGARAGASLRPGALLDRDGSSVQIAAAAPFNGGGVAKSLNWTVVSWKPAEGLALPENTVQNHTVLAGLLGLTAAAACLGWLHIVVARPLRTLAAQAEALADGDRRTVLYPRHHDEVGAVVRSLELIRQELQEQRKRDSAPLAGRN